MGLSASQGRLLLLTARRSDLEFRAQQISQKRLVLSQQLEEISMEYENATSDRQMKITMFLNGTNDGTSETARTSNLTYAALVSGTVGASGPRSAYSGIQASDVVGTADCEYASNTPYRLVSVDGAIVVADTSEIPNTFTKETTTYSEASKLNDNVYRPKETINTPSGTSTEKDKGIYIVAGKKDGSEGNEKSALQQLFDSKNYSDVEYDATQGIIRVDTRYFNTNGEEIDVPEGGFTGTDATLVAEKSNIPQNTIINQTMVSSGAQIKTGADNVYTITMPDGSVQRYIVDPSLRFGSTDVNGSTSGPNYLQDCLRNGKYLLEKGAVDKNDSSGYRWSSVSWDATTNISDSYYTENDDVAKAKYDRLQTQIQNQDKKLELELDNIETQRQAVTTEVESVQKVIDEDIEGSFNSFA